MVVKVMSDYPLVCLEDGLLTAQWLKRQQAFLNPTGCDGAIGLNRDIVGASNGASYACRFLVGHLQSLRWQEEFSFQYLWKSGVSTGNHTTLHHY